MAISDYTMSRLAQLQGARNTALEIERQRAARQADQYRQNLSYLNTLLQTGGNLLVQVPGVMQKLEAADLAKLDTNIGAASKLIGTELAPAETPVMPTAVGPAIPEIPTERLQLAAPQIAPTPTQPLSLGVTSPAGVGATQALMPPTPQGVPATAPGVTTDDLGGAFQPPPPERQIERRSVAAPKFAELPTPFARATAPATPATPATKRVFTSEPPVTEAELQGVFQPPPPERQIERRGATPTERIRVQTTAEPAPMRDTTATPVSDPTAAVGPSITVPPRFSLSGMQLTIPTVEELKSKGIDIEKPAVSAALEKAPRFTGWTAPKFISEDEAVDKVFNIIKKDMPRGNPIANMLAFGDSTNQAKKAEEMAKLKIRLEIREARKAATQESFANFVEQEEFRQKQALNEARIADLQAQAANHLARAEKVEATVTVRKQLPTADRVALQSQRMAVDKLNDIKDNLQDMTKDGKLELPFGAIRQFKKAAAAAAGINIGTMNEAQIDASLATGVANAKGTIKSLSGGKMIDFEAFDKAFTALEKQGYDQKTMKLVRDYNQAIQMIGKALEGGKLTDADAIRYSNMLFSTENPEAFIDSLNDLGESIVKNYNETNASLRETYATGFGQFPSGYEWEPFNRDDIQITEMELAAGARELSIPTRGVSLAGLSLKTVEELQTLLERTTDPAEKRKIDDAIKAKSRVSPPKKSSTKPNKLGGFGD